MEDIDDGAMPTFRHLLADAAGDQECTAQINVYLAVPVLYPHVFDRVHLAKNAGSVHEARDRAVPRLYLGNAADNYRLARYVERRGPQDRISSLRLFRRNVGDDDSAALLGKQGGDCSPDAAAPACDQDDAISAHRQTRMH